MQSEWETTELLMSWEVTGGNDRLRSVTLTAVWRTDCGGRGGGRRPGRRLEKGDGDCSSKDRGKWWDLVWGQDLRIDIGCQERNPDSCHI